MGDTPIRRILAACFVFAVSLPLTSAAIWPASATAQVVINEIFPNPSLPDAGNERIEIFNAGPSAVDMTGWAIDDAATIDEVAVRARIPEDLDPACSTSAIIGPGEFRVLKMYLDAAVLNNSGDDVYLVSDRLAFATVVHAVTYPSASFEIDQGWAAVPDGSANYDWRDLTLCASNGGTGDVIAPGAVSDLVATPGAFPGEIRLTWTAPGDDGVAGTASNYIFKVSNALIDAGNFDSATDLDFWINEPLPAAGGEAETLFVFGLDVGSTYFFALETQDEAPNTSAVSNSPSTMPLGGTPLDPDLGYNVYYGNLHSHTSYSDGDLTPAQAYDYARNDAPTPLDFLAVTDHNHVGAGMQLSNYALGLSQAASANDDGNFVAIWGQEWGLAANGHVNIFEAPVLFGWDPGQYDVFVAEGNYAGLYTAALANPPASYPVLLEWNHPQTGNFASFAPTANGFASVHLMALVNGPAQSTSTTESDVGNTGFDPEFQDALRIGYRVSPVADQDNHNPTWGAATESRTAVLTAGLTKSEILSALAARRNYATQDHNTVVQFSADGHAMGEAFSSPSGIRIAAHVSDPDPGETAAQIDLFRGVTGVANATIVATNIGNADFAWREVETFEADTEVHYYLRVRMADNQTIWTGPVYVTYAAVAVAVGERPQAASLALAVSPNPAVERATVDFVLPQAARNAEIAVFDAAGRRVTTLLAGPLAAGAHRVTWSGREAGGRHAAAGIFFVRLRADDQSAMKKILRLR